MTYTVTLMRIMFVMGNTPTEASIIRKPIRGQGGFQSLLRKLQHQLGGRQLDVSPVDVERLRRYSAAYGGGGFQRRTQRVIP
ncbi:MAG: hypothetical protein ABJA98_23640 [Acidobacteriota bacterium]